MVSSSFTYFSIFQSYRFQYILILGTFYNILLVLFWL